MSQILKTIDVNVPVNTSYNQWTQFEKFHEFLPEVDSIVQVDDTHTDWTVSVAGVTRKFSTVIAEQIPDNRIAWTSTNGEVDHAGVATFHKLSDTTSRVAIQIDWEPTGLLEKAGAALNIPDQAVQHALDKFKEYVEAQGIADGAWRGTVA